MTADLTAAEASARAALLTVRSYDVHLDLTAGPDTARSHTTLHFGCAEPGASTFADLTAPRVHAIVLNGAPLDPAEVLTDGRLRLAGLAASNTLVVDAEFGYARDGNGLERFTDPADGGRYVLANCFPTYAPRLYCCFDQLDLRAELTLSVQAPAGWECVSNGPVVARPARGRAGRWQFGTAPALRPCDLTLCAGPYVTVPVTAGNEAGVPLTVRARRSLAHSAGLGQVASAVRRVIGFYERYLGVPCPYEKVDITFPPELGPTAMQLPGTMFIGEKLLDRMAGDGDPFAARILAHEAAHLWFDCMVGYRWWDDLWLGEAVATYLSYVASTAALGIPAPWAEFAMGGQAAAYQADSGPSAEPIAAPVATAADAMSRPMPIVYNKGAAVIRQLAALIGDDALRVGLGEFLTRHAWTAATGADLIGCWSRASGRDLTGWADQWLRQAGVNTLRPSLAGGPGGRIGELAICQDPPPGAVGPLRRHRINVAVYDQCDTGLTRRTVITAEVDGPRTVLAELAGDARPAALVVNTDDLTFARTRFDDASLRALLAAGLRLDDPLTEAVCWNAAFDMTVTAELSPADFVRLVAGRARAGQPIAGLHELLAQAVLAADLYSPPALRPGLRGQLAAAALAGLERAAPASRAQRALATGFAASAHSDSQLGLLRDWLRGPDPLPAGLGLGRELHAQVLRTLAARGLSDDDDLANYAAADSVSGDLVTATGRALRPDLAAKEDAWSAVLDRDQPPRLARACAEGFWVAGQEHLLAPFGDRYFSQALPALGSVKPRSAQRLLRLLYPAQLADPRTLARTDAELGRLAADDPFRPVLIERRALLAQVLAARAVASQTRLS